MAHLHKKIKKGRPYYYVREMARVDGNPKVVNQVYIGSVNRILSLAANAPRGEEIIRLQAQEFGALWLANHIESKVGLANIIDAIFPETDFDNTKITRLKGKRASKNPPPPYTPGKVSAGPSPPDLLPEGWRDAQYGPIYVYSHSAQSLWEKYP